MADTQRRQDKLVLSITRRGLEARPPFLGGFVEPRANAHARGLTKLCDRHSLFKKQLLSIFPRNIFNGHRVSKNRKLKLLLLHQHSVCSGARILIVGLC